MTLHAAYAAHTIQLSVKKALNANDDIKILILRVKRLISFFGTQKQLQALEKMQKSLDFPKILKPISDVCTRWNSTYRAWTRLIEIKR